MKKQNYLLHIAMIILAIGSLASCTKDGRVQPATQEDFAVAKSTLEIIKEINSLNTMAIDITQSGGSKGAKIVPNKEADCGVVTTGKDNSGAELITIDFGDGQKCVDGVTRKGKLVFTFNEVGDNVSIQFANYQIDSKKLEGKYSINITYPDESILYNFKFENAVFTDKDGSKTNWNSDYSLAWRFVPAKDDSFGRVEMQTAGELLGKDRHGREFVANTASPIIFTTSCPYGAVSGAYRLKSEEHPDAICDFGNGTCNPKATLTINNITQEVSL